MLGLLALAIGTLGQWATVAGVVALAWIFHRGGGGTALSTLSEANRVLERRVTELASEERDLKAELSELRTRTDYAAQTAELHAAIASHDESARKQWREMLNVLELIAARLGPDANGAAGEHG